MNKKYIFLILLISIFLILTPALWPKASRFSFHVSASKRFATQDWFEKQNKDAEHERPTDGEESHNGDDSLIYKKRMRDFRAYPLTTIPQNAKLNAFQQFQSLYPENQSLNWKSVSTGKNPYAR